MHSLFWFETPSHLSRRHLTHWIFKHQLCVFRKVRVTLVNCVTLSVLDNKAALCNQFRSLVPKVHWRNQISSYYERKLMLLMIFFQFLQEKVCRYWVPIFHFDVTNSDREIRFLPEEIIHSRLAHRKSVPRLGNMRLIWPISTRYYPYFVEAELVVCLSGHL